LIGGSVTGAGLVGSLVGINGGQIFNAYSTAAVDAWDQVGGLVGRNDGTIHGAYATGAVSGVASVGGLVGLSYGEISNSYATGSVTGLMIGGTGFGGLVGVNVAMVSDSYATGAVTSSGSGNGGLAGENYGGIFRAYSTGRVIGADQTGGLVGSSVTWIVDDSFWDIQTSGQSHSEGGIGKTSAEMRDANTFSAWDISAAGGSSAVWRIYDGYTSPLLRSFLTGVTVAVDDISSTYYGVDQSFNVTYDASGLDPRLIFADNAIYRNAGSYSLGGYLYSGQQGYDISYTGGTLDIARASLTVSGLIAADKTYDATVMALVSGGVLNGVISGDVVDLLQSGSFADKNAGTGKVVMANLSLDGADAGNYVLVNSTAMTTANISRASITNVFGITADDKVYDSTVSTMLNTTGAAFTGVFAGDQLSVGGASGMFSDRNAATGKNVMIMDITLSGADAGNYTLVSTTATTTASISRASINVSSITAADKVYDGNTSATVYTAGATFAGVFAGDLLSVGSATGAFTDKNAAVDKTVAITGITLAGADAGNYVLVNNTAMTTASITPASLMITADDKSKVFGTANPELTLSYSGFVAGEDASVLTTQPTASTTADTTSPLGDYAITAAGAAGQNYVFTYVPGTLTVFGSGLQLQAETQ
jgi:hypothetical protein